MLDSLRISSLFIYFNPVTSESVTAAFPLSDFFPFTFLITFLGFCAHIFLTVFAFISLTAICILLDFSHNSALFNVIRKSFSKKIEHLSIRVH